MSLTVRLAYKLTLGVDSENCIKDDLEFNTLQAAMHITLIFGTAIATLVQFTFFEIYRSYEIVSVNRSVTSMYALGAMQDIFLAYNMLFILDQNKLPSIIRDENRQVSYALKNVIDERA